MALSAGDRLGSYEVLAPIGAGGMGEVYRARDTKLDRDVAIKVLPAALAQDPERLTRFEREAKVLASLNHPNIAQIYGIEDRALVMELVEGQTLHGPLPLETALSYARQIADALEAAHEKNIIHRDLKPANIMITPAGVVKVLDFGLAVTSRDREGADAVNSPTLTISPTRAGMILGTAGYMSPEQARGKAVDKRADIWAFGVVLFEMLSGKRLFEGETISDTLAQVLTKEPDLSKLPAKVRRLLEACLQKDPKQRLQAIGDWRLLLTDVLPQAIAPWRRGWIATAAVLSVVAAVGLTGWYRATRPVEQLLRPLVRLNVDLGSDVSLDSSPAGADAIISPDGTRLVYGSQNRLFTLRLDQPRATELAGTEGASAPFFSPDGQWVAFFTTGKLRKISVDGGAAITLCDASVASAGGSWGEDGNIIAALAGPASGLSRIPSSGGEPTLVAEQAQGGGAYLFPQILPGGKAVLFTSANAIGQADAFRIEVVSLRDRHRKTLVQGGAYGRYLATSQTGTGYLSYVSQGTLFAVPFDLEKLEVRGTPVPVVEQVAYSTLDGSAQLDFSRSGTVVYRSGAGARLLTVQWLDATGKTQPLLTKPGVYGRPSLSPDGRRLALEVTEGSDSDIWVYDWQRDTMTRLTFTGTAHYPQWTSGSPYILFGVTGGGMFWTGSDGAGQPQTLTRSKIAQIPWSFTPDGKRLAFMEMNPATALDVRTVPVELDSAGPRAGKPEVFLETPANEKYPSFSPDGRWMAYSSDDSGTSEIYVRAFPDQGRKWQISNSGGAYPMWSRIRSELFFETLDNRIMVAAYAVNGGSFVASKPRLWSETRIGGVANNSRNVDLAPDGKRFAALMPADAPESRQAQSHVILLENFFDELRRRVPVDKK
jgi:serine/threonine-protein kinase